MGIIVRGGTLPGVVGGRLRRGARSAQGATVMRTSTSFSLASMEPRRPPALKLASLTAKTRQHFQMQCYTSFIYVMKMAEHGKHWKTRIWLMRAAHRG